MANNKVLEFLKTFLENELTTLQTSESFLKKVISLDLTKKDVNSILDLLVNLNKKYNNERLYAYYLGLLLKYNIQKDFLPIISKIRDQKYQYQVLVYAIKYGQELGLFKRNSYWKKIADNLRNTKIVDKDYVFKKLLGEILYFWLFKGENIQTFVGYLIKSENYFLKNPGLFYIISRYIFNSIFLPFEFKNMYILAIVSTLKTPILFKEWLMALVEYLYEQEYVTMDSLVGEYKLPFETLAFVKDQVKNFILNNLTQGFISFNTDSDYVEELWKLVLRHTESFSLVTNVWFSLGEQKTYFEFNEEYLPFAITVLNRFFENINVKNMRNWGIA